MKSKSFQTQKVIQRFCCRAFSFVLPFLALRSSSPYAEAHRSASTWISPVRINSLVGLVEYAEDSWLRSMMNESYLPSSIHNNWHQDRKLTSSTNVDTELSLLTLQFSLWYPSLHDKVTEPDEQVEYFLLVVLAVLRDFVCRQISHVVMVNPTNHSLSLCASVGSVTEDLGVFVNANETIQSPTGFDVLLTFGHMVVSQEKDDNVDWMSWEVTYQVVQEGRLSTPMHIHQEFTLQSTIQSVLERSIRRGTLNKGLRKYLDSSRPTFSIVGQEMETFYESAMALLDQYDFSSDAFLLRQIGIAILILVTCIYSMLTAAARNHRLLRERQRTLETQRPQYCREEVRRSSMRKSVGNQTMVQQVLLLETEDDVNLMLAVGRDESMKKLNLSRGVQGRGSGIAKTS